MIYIASLSLSFEAPAFMQESVQIIITIKHLIQQQLEQEMILSSQLINSTPHFINQSNERQLDLRRKGIREIGNTEATANYFQCIDLSENAIVALSNFTFLDRVRTLVASNNKIRLIQDVSCSLPNLQNLFLMGNKIAELEDLLALRNCKNLKRLNMINNAVTTKANYRKFVICTIKSLKILDFKAISSKERREAEQHFSIIK